MRFPYKGAGIGLVRDGRILIGIRSKKPFIGKWSVPGGGMEKGETYLETAMREFCEETSCDLSPMQRSYLGAWTLCLPPFFHWTTFFFKTDDPEPSISPSEFTRLEWISLDEVNSLPCRPFTWFEMRKLRRLLERSQLGSK